MLTILTLLSCMHSCVSGLLACSEESRPSITYSPMSVMDEERQKHLNKMYKCDDVECANMLRMRRASF